MSYDRELIEKLEEAIEREDEDVLRIVEDALIDERFDFIRKYTLPAMIDNEFAPAYGWSGEFRKVNKYIEFADSLVGEEGWAYETLVEHVKKYIEDYATDDEIEEAKEIYEDEWLTKLAEEIVYGFSLDLDNVIEILRRDLLYFVKENKDKVDEWIERNFGFDETLFELGTEEILDIVDKYGYMNELKEALGLYRR